MQISIHSSHTGRDGAKMEKTVLATAFQSTLPIREETVARHSRAPPIEFQSTLPIREETRQAIKAQIAELISIHSSHTGRDPPCWRREGTRNISIHSSHTGRDFVDGAVIAVPGISIHSSHTGRDSGTEISIYGVRAYFNPLFPYGKRRLLAHGEAQECEISIHSSHTGRDGAGSFL